jgi:alginate O-acetyltransferase complex protein AlgF
MKNISLLAKLLATFLLTTNPVFADDDSLYAEALPNDVSFLRFLGFDGQSSAIFAGFKFDLSADVADKYIPVSAAQLSGVDAGTYTTILRTEDGTFQTIGESARSRQSKVTLFLVNGTDAALELRLVDDSIAVIEDVGPATSALREVNPVAINLGVFKRGQCTPLATFDIILQRGQNISFIADETGVRLIENEFAALAK